MSTLQGGGDHGVDAHEQRKSTFIQARLKQLGVLDPEATTLFPVDTGQTKDSLDDDPLHPVNLQARLRRELHRLQAKSILH